MTVSHDDLDSNGSINQLPRNISHYIVPDARTGNIIHIFVYIDANIYIHRILHRNRFSLVDWLFVLAKLQLGSAIAVMR